MSTQFEVKEDVMAVASEHINLGRLQEARDALNAWLQHHPTDSKANALLAYVAFLKNDYQSALNAAISAISHYPLNGEAYLIKGFALAELGQPIEAIQALRRVLALNPACLEARSLAAKLLIGQNRREEAQALLHAGRSYGMTEVEITDILATPFSPAPVTPSTQQPETKVEVTWVAPHQLLHPGRLDIVVKALYARTLLNLPSMHSGIDTEDLYLRHILFRTGGAEPGDEKRKGTLSSFKEQFIQLVASMKARQFNPEYSIPVSRRTGLILNGAHRLAAALALGIKQVPVIYQDDVDGLTWNFEWFLQQGFSPIELDEIVRTWIDFKGEQAGCIILWSTVEAQWPEIEKHIEKVTPIACARTIELPQHAFAELVRDLYATDGGPVPADNIERKITFFKEYSPRFRLLVVAQSVPGSLTTLKQQLRDQWNHIVPADRFATLHTTDNAEQTAYVADVLLNRASLTALLQRPAGFRPAYLAWLQECHAAFHQLKLHTENACIVGSGVLEAYGVREATDIDFTVTHAIRAKYFTPGVTHLTPNLDVVAKDYPRVIGKSYPAPTDNDLIRDRALHIRVRGFKFAALDVVLTRKQVQRRPKDLTDVALASALRLNLLVK